MARSSRLGRLAFGAAGALAVASLLACNAIIGLSDFEKVECTNLRCPDDAGGLDVFVPPSDAGPDADDGGTTVGTEPVVWARWKMPSWDAGPDPTPKYTLTDGTASVYEDLTGLTWYRAELGSFSYDEAKAKCAGLPGGTWRLPKRIELVSLLDFGRGAGQPVISALFPDAKQALYWTSSEAKPIVTGAPKYWVVDFSAAGNGGPLVKRFDATTSTVAYVRCVKGKS